MIVDGDLSTGHEQMVPQSRCFSPCSPSLGWSKDSCHTHGPTNWDGVCWPSAECSTPGQTWEQPGCCAQRAIGWPASGIRGRLFTNLPRLTSHSTIINSNSVGCVNTTINVILTTSNIDCCYSYVGADLVIDYHHNIMLWYIFFVCCTSFPLFCHHCEH